MQRGQAEPTNGLPVLGRAIASVALQAIARITLRKPIDQAVAGLLGQHPVSGDGH
eukprot:gene5810-7697_t